LQPDRELFTLYRFVSVSTEIRSPRRPLRFNAATIYGSCIFPRNARWNLAEYLSERLEMNSQNESYGRPKQERKNMKTRTLKQTCSTALIVIAALTIAFSFASAQAPERTMSERTIQGAWRTMVTPVNCQTGDPLGPPFAGLFTFNKGGTMSEYGIGPGSSPALRSPGHGVWQREHGWQDYSFTFTFYRYDASGLFIGSQKVNANLGTRRKRR